MTRRRVGLSSIILVAAVVVLANCDSATQPTVQADNQPQAASGHDYYKLIEESLTLPSEGVKISKLIGFGGGVLSSNGYTLTVQPGAVTVPTLFTMTLLSSSAVDVELTATVKDAYGRTVDVGAAGFRQPVWLTLPYDRATNVEKEGDLMIVLIDGDSHEWVNCIVDQKARNVTGRLNHFSKYAMAED